MEIKYFENGFVGKAVYDTNEAIKCFNAGMDVRQTDGDDFLWENEEHEDPSDNEIIGRIIHVINDYGMVYVGFKLEGQKVVDINTTTLTCDFKIGQSVYFLDNGEICSSTIKEISLTAGGVLNIVGSNMFSFLKDHLDSEARPDDVRDMEVIASGNFVYLKQEGSIDSCMLPINKIFPTKEALVQDLLSKSK